MERNRFLELATRYVNGEDVRVMCDGIEYHPLWYILKPIKGGGWSHTAHMKDTIAVESHREAPLEDLMEAQEKKYKEYKEFYTHLKTPKEIAEKANADMALACVIDPGEMKYIREAAEEAIKDLNKIKEDKS